VRGASQEIHFLRKILAVPEIGEEENEEKDQNGQGEHRHGDDGVSLLLFQTGLGIGTKVGVEIPTIFGMNP
tara:strand:+ start:408 stop:620 length:213 start_codon:yes stop_codon:yes gene_type:complete